MDNPAYDNIEGDSQNDGTNLSNEKQNVAVSALQKVIKVEQEADIRKDEQRNRKPLLFCKWITQCPKTLFFITLGPAYALVIATFVMMAFGYDIIPIVFERLPLDIRDNTFYLRGLSWQHRDESDSIYVRGSGDDKQALRSQLRESVVFIYEEPGGNVLTRHRLAAIQKNEEEFFYQRKFQNDFCHLVDAQCATPRSIIRFFDGTYEWLNSAFNDPTFENISAVVALANYYNETKQMLEFILPSKAVIEAGRAQASIIRSTISIGWPLKTYDNNKDKEDEQQDKVENYFYNDFISEGQKKYRNGVDGMKFYYSSPSLFLVYVINQSFKDMALLCGSLAFIFFFMWFQTRSLFITIFSLMSIITSFFIANIIYRVVLDYRYFGFFHVLALFIILGIGADDIFVFYDTWRETVHYKFASLAHRLSYVYRRASLAMLWTSLTTAIAFIVSATSPFIGINTFGVFAGLLVFVNYMSVIIFFPTVVVIYHLYFEKYCCCCCCVNKTLPNDNEQEPHMKRNIIVRCFAIYYFKFITNKIMAVFILAAFATLLGVFLYFASGIKVQEEQIEFLPQETNFGGFVQRREKHFNTGDRPIRVFIVWGLQEQDVSNCHQTDVECIGKTVWDNKFTMQTAENQAAVLELCNTIKNLPKKRLNELRIKINRITNKPDVYCFSDAMKNFFKEEQTRHTYNPATNITEQRYPNGTELDYPLGRETALTIMNHTGWIYSSTLDESYDRWFEIGMSHWIYNGFQPGLPGQTFKIYNKFLGVTKDKYSVKSSAHNNGYIQYPYYYGTKLRYAAIAINTTIKPASLGFLEGIPIRDDWEDFISKEIKKMPKGLRKGYQCTPVDLRSNNLWHWLDVQRTLVSSAVTGIVVGLCCALPVLIIATMNIIVGVMATINIALITATVIGFIPLMGWKLGFMESLNLVLVVGLAVDYCVHLAEGYSRSTHYDRKGRLHDALQEVGISVISGCITTIGASAFMLFAVIVFFTQFGFFLLATLGFSFLYSMVFFCTCLGLFGPEGDFGSLRVLFEKLCCWSRCCKKTKSSKYRHSNNVF